MPLTDSSADIQASIAQLLLADPEIIALVADRVYDRIPNVPLFPYITVGEVSAIPELGEFTDATDSTITIHTWERFKGFGAVKRVGKVVVKLLHDADLQISGAAVQSLLLESSRYIRDPDGLTSHGIFTFSILTDASSS